MLKHLPSVSRCAASHRGAILQETQNTLPAKLTKAEELGGDFGRNH